MINIKRYIITNCISFTFVIVFYALISMLGMEWTMSNDKILQLFILTSCIAVLQFFTDKLTEKNWIATIITSLLDVFVTIFFMGGVMFKMFQLNASNIIVISIMILLVFILVHGIMLIQGKMSATAINKKLEKMRLDIIKRDEK